MTSFDDIDLGSSQYKTNLQASVDQGGKTLQYSVRLGQVPQRLIMGRPLQDSGAGKNRLRPRHEIITPNVSFQGEFL